MKRVFLVGILAAMVFCPLAGFAQNDTLFEYPFPAGTVLTVDRPIIIRGKLEGGAESIKAYSCVGTGTKCKVDEAKKNPWSVDTFKPAAVTVDPDRKEWTIQITLVSSHDPFNLLIVSVLPLTPEQKQTVKKNLLVVVDEYSKYLIAHLDISSETDDQQLTAIYRKYFPAATDKYMIGDSSLLKTLESWRGGSDTNYVNQIVQSYRELNQGKLVSVSDGQVVINRDDCVKYFKDTDDVEEKLAAEECDTNIKALQDRFAEINAIVSTSVDLYSTSLDSTSIEEIRKWLGFNAGLAYIPEINEIQPYIGLSIYFANQDNVDFESWKCLASRISLAGGYSFKSEQFPIEDKNVSNLYFIGFGYRLNPYASIIAGETFYDFTTDDGHDQRSVGFVSLTVETFALQTILDSMAKPFVK